MHEGKEKTATELVLASISKLEQEHRSKSESYQRAFGAMEGVMLTTQEQLLKDELLESMKSLENEIIRLKTSINK
jgi:hypothetical protein